MEHPNAEILRAIADGKKMQYRRVVTGHGRKYTSIWYNFDVKDAEACCNLLQPLGKAAAVPQGWKLVQIELLERIQESLLWLGRLKTLYLKGKKSASGGLTTIPFLL